MRQSRRRPYLEFLQYLKDALNPCGFEQRVRVFAA